MRKFIPLSVFKTLYSSQSDLLTNEGMISFREKLVVDGNRIAEEAGFHSDQFMAFEETLSNPSRVIFYGWIEQHAALKKALLGEPLVLFVDSAKHLDHSLSKEYQTFLSPVLSDRLLRTEINSDSERMIAFSFVQLLDERHRSVVEDKLFQPFQGRLNELKTVSDATQDEQRLVNFVKPLCSDEIIASVNYLSRASYASKLSYIDKILNTIHSDACTVRFANWVLERLSKVKLNDEHQYKLSDLRKDLRQGNLIVKNHKNGNAPIKWKTVIMLLVILLLVGSVIYLITYQPFSKVQETEFTNSTSFREFSKKERIHMDSLLREMDNPFDKIDELDPINTRAQTGVDIDLVLRKEFKNEKMETIYSDLMLDVELKENYPNSNCLNFKDMALKPSAISSSLESRTGTHTAVVRNESEYGIVLYISENNKKGEVYAATIEPNETIEFKINEYNTMLIVAGNSYQPFLAPTNSKEEELPSKAFVHHFCETDLNYEETINTTYQFMHPRQGKNKFMVMGAKSGYVHLVDVHGVLEAY